MKVAVIVGSVRPGRASDRIAKWVATQAKKLDDTEVSIVDLHDHQLPFFDEMIPPQYNPDRQPDQVVQKWLDAVADADAYVLITPEYNRSIPGVLKNALDFLDFQMANKPVALVAHGSVGGAHAIVALRITLPGNKAFTIPDAVYISGQAGQLFDEDGVLDAEVASNPRGPQGALEAALEQLKWYSDALSPTRTK